MACLYVPRHLDPNAIFETINCRGKHLEELDLIRNHLYSYFNDEAEASRRDEFHENLERFRIHLGDDQKAGVYARCFFQCKYGHLPKEKFYRTVKKNIANTSQDTASLANHVYDLVGELSKKSYVQLFRTLTTLRTGQEFISDFLKDSRKTSAKRNLQVFINELREYSVAQPLLFSLLVHYVKAKESNNNEQKREFAKGIHSRIQMVTSFVSRMSFIGKFQPSDYESEFSNMASQIMSANSPFEVDILARLRECDNRGIMDDHKFISMMSLAELKGVKKIRRLLYALNTKLQQSGDIILEDKCTVEHVLPKSEQHWEHWNKFERGTHKEWAQKPGNLTLLGERENKPDETANRDFSQKKLILSRSTLSIAQEISTYSTWGPTEIEERQKKLAERAATVWTFPSI